MGFNAVLMSEHFGAFFAFVVLHVALLVGGGGCEEPDRRLYCLGVSPGCQLYLGLRVGFVPAKAGSTLGLLPPSLPLPQVSYVRRMLSPSHFAVLTTAVISGALVLGGLAGSAVLAYVAKSPTLGWTGGAGPCHALARTRVITYTVHAVVCGLLFMNA